MHIASALRRKRDEIAATIAAYEARTDAARMDLAALDQAARLFDPETGRDAVAIHRDFGRLGKPQEIGAAQCEARERERPSAMGELTLPCASQRAATTPLRSNPLAFERAASQSGSRMPRRRRRENSFQQNFLFELAVIH
jgi:hypothetical protein